MRASMRAYKCVFARKWVINQAPGDRLNTWLNAIMRTFLFYHQFERGRESVSVLKFDSVSMGTRYVSMSMVVVVGVREFYGVNVRL